MNNTADLIKAINAGKPVVLMIVADDCQPCEQAKPSFYAAQDAHSDVVTFFMINVKELDPTFLRLRQVRSAPTALFFAFGLESNRLTGNEVVTVGSATQDLIELFHTENAGFGEDFECEACQ